MKLERALINAAQTGSLRIEKTSSDGKVEGFSFRVTGANGYDQTFKTDEHTARLRSPDCAWAITPYRRYRTMPAPTMCCLLIRR
ncbi:MAG: hypothetical protein ACLTLQ_10870 [[Clostridium] scindens]